MGGGAVPGGGVVKRKGGKDQEEKGREGSEERGPAVWGFKDAEFAARKGSVTEAEERLRGP